MVYSLLTRGSHHIRMTMTAGQFRNKFTLSRGKLNWFPGHMRESFIKMQSKVRAIDCAVEVHDARIPFTGRNSMFLKNLIGNKPHILVLNKRDLISKSNIKIIEEKCAEENCENVIFSNCLDQNCSGIKKIIPIAIDLIRKEKYFVNDEVGYQIMVLGVPNVGKSSVINALRNVYFAKGKATRVGGEAGVTRSVQTKIKVSTNPPTYLIDTPGILEPNISNIECGMKLALCACLNDSTIGIVNIADFLLYWMNKTNKFDYVEYFGLQKPVDEVVPLLVKIATDLNKSKRVKNIVNNSLEVIPNVEAAAQIMVSLYRKGQFGDLELDKDLLKY